MTSLTHEGPTVRRPTPWWQEAVDMWASLAITAIWLAVSLTAIFGPDMRFQSHDGSGSTIPSAAVVALCGLFATSAVAKYAFGRNRH
jgi:hypothetical protein